MEVIIDVREKALIQSMQRCGTEVKITVKQLDLGDVHLVIGDKIVCVIERKTTNDLESSIRDGRYKEQAGRLKGLGLKSKNIIYLIEGNYVHHRPSRFGRGIEGGALVSAMVSLWYTHGFTVVNSFNLDMSCFYILASIKKIGKLMVDCPEANSTISITSQFVTPKSLKNPSNIIIPLLCQIPSVSIKTATAISLKFPTMKLLINKLESAINCLNEITTMTNDKSRKISKKCKERIVEYLGIKPSST